MNQIGISRCRSTSCLLFLACYIFFCCTSCSLFRKASAQTDQPTGQTTQPGQIEREPPIKEDLKETELQGELLKPDANELEPIETNDWETNPYEVHDLAVLLPFDVGRAFNADTTGESIPRKSLMAVEFYQGMLLAFDELQREGVSLNVSVHDTENSPFKVEQIARDPNLAQADLIIGPLFNKNVSALSRYSFSRQIFQVSPLSPSEDLVTDNPYFLQATPSASSHVDAIANYLLLNKRARRIIVVTSSKPSELALADRIQSWVESGTIVGEFAGVEMVNLIVDEEETFDFKPYLEPGAENIVVVPSFDGVFAQKIVSELHLEHKRYPILLFGMPNWIKFKSANLDYLSDLKCHITSVYWVDERSPDHIRFKQNYYSRTNTLPSETACRGYDMMLYFGRQLQTNGRNFPLKFGFTDDSGIYSKFQFSGVNSSVGGQAGFGINHYENKYVHILRFENFEFYKVN